MIKISDLEIEEVERLLLPADCIFNEERRAFLKCMESKDVLACPGSGKTTALLAKIIVISKKMPFSNKKGICVLTHTNVAINEIKKKLGSKADYLFHYPNFFGTIQTFVDKFLAIPFYKSEQGHAPESLDIDIYNKKVEQSYFIKNKWLETRGGLETLQKYWLSPEDLSIQKNLSTQIPKLGKHTATYKSINEIRKRVFDSGYLSFNDAYSLAYRYLLAKPSLKEVFSNRFSFVFIDEMQDTDTHQLDLLDKIFDSNKIVVQRLGDTNQAIFTDVKSENSWIPVNCLHFSDSKRFGPNINNILTTVRLDQRISLVADDNIESLKPHIFSFTLETIDKVLPNFANKIIQFGLHEVNKTDHSHFKAVGWIGKDNTNAAKLCIRSYFSDYDKSLLLKDKHYSNLISYLSPMLKTATELSVNLYRKSIYEGMARVLELGEYYHPDSARSFTGNSLIRYLKNEYEPLYFDIQKKISEWLSCLVVNSKTIEEIKNELTEIIKDEFPLEDSSELQDFINDNQIQFSSSVLEKQNIYLCEHNVPIQLGTVHSVKGETHVATLYLDTDYQRKLDSKRLLKFCKGEYPVNERSKVRHQENLKMAHVAFSRPSHFLAFACLKENIDGHETELEQNGWVIEEV